MKNILTFSVLLFSSLLVSAQEGYTAKELAAKGLKRYNVESGIIKCTYSGIMTGEQTIRFDKWGWRESTKGAKSTNMMGFQNTDNTETYLDGITQYTFDPAKKTATKIDNTFLKGIIDGGNAKSLTDAGEQMLKDMGGVKVGTEEILGKTCDIYEMKNYGTKTWVWNGVTLKTEMNMMGMTYNMIATSFKEGADVSEDELTLPAVATITEGPALPEGFNFGGMGGK